jgi:hypothetical protein
MTPFIVPGRMKYPVEIQDVNPLGSPGADVQSVLTLPFTDPSS